MHRFQCGALAFAAFAGAAAPACAASPFAHPQRMVEPAHEDAAARLNLASNEMMDKVASMQSAMVRQCVDQAAKGFAPGSALAAMCSGGHDYGAGLPRDLAAARLSNLISAAYWRAFDSESGNGDASDAQLRAARRGFGDLPLVVLTRGVSPYAQPGQPQSALNKAVEDENRKIHQELAAQSTRGRERVVAGADHAIPIQRPQAVVLAVAEVLDEVEKVEKGAGSSQAAR